VGRSVLIVDDIGLITRFKIFVKLLLQGGVHSALVRINDELLERKVAAPV
jgi:hypothetical protein